jgi:predicted esterase
MYVFDIADKLDKFMPTDKEFIVVGVDCNTMEGAGSFFANSEVIGNWDEFMIKEIIPYIDENYRSLADVNSRACMGFSMGGFIALNMAFLHPDTFSSTLAMAPGLLRDDQLDEAMKSWQSDRPFLEAYGHAFAPNTENEDLCDIPTLDGSEEDNTICDKWLSGYGHLEEKVDKYLELNQPLKKIQIVYGIQDVYSWIPEGCKYMSELMTEKGIDHTLSEAKNGHTIPRDFIENYVVPFYSDALSFTE